MAGSKKKVDAIRITYPKALNHDLPTPDKNRQRQTFQRIPGIEKRVVPLEIFNRDAFEPDQRLQAIPHVPANTCYRNAMLAALFNVAPFVNYINTVGNAVYGSEQALSKDALQQPEKFIIFKYLADLHQEFRHGGTSLRDHATRFWNYLRKVPGAYPKNTDESNDTWEERLLHGMKIDRGLNSAEDSLELYMYLMTRLATVEQPDFLAKSLHKNFKAALESRFIDENPALRTCPYCRVESKTTCFYKLSYLPEVLAIPLVYDKEYDAEKGAYEIDMTVHTNLPEFLDMSALDDSEPEHDDAGGGERWVYRLESFVAAPFNLNSRDASHYTAFLRRDDNTWEHIDDMGGKIYRETKKEVWENDFWRPRLAFYVLDRTRGTVTKEPAGERNPMPTPSPSPESDKNASKNGNNGTRGTKHALGGTLQPPTPPKKPNTGGRSSVTPDPSAGAPIPPTTPTPKPRKKPIRSSTALPPDPFAGMPITHTTPTPTPTFQPTQPSFGGVLPTTGGGGLTGFGGGFTGFTSGGGMFNDTMNPTTAGGGDTSSGAPVISITGPKDTSSSGLPPIDFTSYDDPDGFAGYEGLNYASANPEDDVKVPGYSYYTSGASGGWTGFSGGKPPGPQTGFSAGKPPGPQTGFSAGKPPGPQTGSSGFPPPPSAPAPVVRTPTPAPPALGSRQTPQPSSGKSEIELYTEWVKSQKAETKRDSPKKSQGASTGRQTSRPTKTTTGLRGGGGSSSSTKKKEKKDKKDKKSSKKDKGKKKKKEKIGENGMTEEQEKHYEESLLRWQEAFKSIKELDAWREERRRLREVYGSTPGWETPPTIKGPGPVPTGVTPPPAQPSSWEPREPEKPRVPWSIDTDRDDARIAESEKWKRKDFEAAFDEEGLNAPVGRNPGLQTWRAIWLKHFDQKKRDYTLYSLAKLQHTADVLGLAVKSRLARKPPVKKDYVNAFKREDQRRLWEYKVYGGPAPVELADAPSHSGGIDTESEQEEETEEDEEEEEEEIAVDPRELEIKEGIMDTEYETALLASRATPRTGVIKCSKRQIAADAAARRRARQAASKSKDLELPKQSPRHVPQNAVALGMKRKGMFPPGRPAKKGKLSVQEQLDFSTSSSSSSSSTSSSSSSSSSSEDDDDSSSSSSDEDGTSKTPTISMLPIPVTGTYSVNDIPALRGYKYHPWDCQKDAGE
ncbi:hypothetical protein E8E14_011100 [Neopestalotiopsis sp. 37M]|nr:hypothetical protein E8E14_011100 [Neopestalotiopsis sp. 37M]